MSYLDTILTQMKTLVQDAEQTSTSQQSMLDQMEATITQLSSLPNRSPEQQAEIVKMKAQQQKFKEQMITASMIEQLKSQIEDFSKLKGSGLHPSVIEELIRTSSLGQLLASAK